MYAHTNAVGERDENVLILFGEAYWTLDLKLTMFGAHPCMFNLYSLMQPQLMFV